MHQHTQITCATNCSWKIALLVERAIITCKTHGNRPSNGTYSKIAPEKGTYPFHLHMQGSSRSICMMHGCHLHIHRSNVSICMVHGKSLYMHGSNMSICIKYEICTPKRDITRGGEGIPPPRRQRGRITQTVFT